MKTGSKLQWLLIVGAVWAVLILVVIYFKVIEPEDYFSSPDTSRDLSGFNDDSSVGILKPKVWKIEPTRPAGAIMGQVKRLDGVNDDFMLNWEGELKVGEKPQTENWTTGLLGDDAIELVAFATWVPQPEDVLGANADWDVKLVLRDATTLEVLSDAKVKDLGIPESFRAMNPPKEYFSGKMRLIFRTSTMEYVRFVDVSGGNEKTEAKVTYNLESLDEEEPNQRKMGEWCYYDTALVTWHDAPVKFNAIVLTGEPTVETLDQKLGSQIVFDDLLRMQWIATADGTVTDDTGTYQEFVKSAGLNKEEAAPLFAKPPPKSKMENVTLGDLEFGHPANENATFDELIEKTQEALLGDAATTPIPGGDFYYESGYWEYTSVKDAKKLVPGWEDFLTKHATVPDPVPDNIATAMWLKTKIPTYDWHSKTLVRVSSDDYLNHSGWIREDGSIEWRWEGEEEENDINIHSTRQMADLSKPMTVVFLPKMTELKFRIGGMPDLPNPVDTEDLFDIVLPRLTLPENPESAEDRMMQLIGVATQNGWDINNKWKTGAPKELPADRTFRNKTPQELLNWYVKVTPNAHISYDETQQVLTFNEDEVSFWDKVKAFFSETLEKIRF